jgi:hypothetical protein
VGSDEPGRLAELTDAQFADHDLTREDITLFGARLDPARRAAQVRVEARDAERA